jgi:chaperone required for assembly of F1-ATPase
MRELLEGTLSTDPVDPTQAAGRALRPSLRRRFYQCADVEHSRGEFRVVLDGRPARTPARRMLAAPRAGLAQALAAEWASQREFIDPGKMPLTRLANTIIDGVADSPSAVAEDAAKYLAYDLVVYRAEAPEGLVARQTQAWDPVLTWAHASLGAGFVPAKGAIVSAPQPAHALDAARAAIPRDPWRLGAFHAVTTLTGSALIALALAHGALSVARAWSAAHVDEDWNMELWGRDELALERRASRFAEMQAAARVLEAA